MAVGAFASLAFQSWVISTCLEKANGKHAKLSILCSQAILRNCYSVFRLLPGPIDITDLKDGPIVAPLFAAKEFWWTGLRHGEIQAFIKASSGRMWRTNWNVTEPHMGVHVWLNPIPNSQTAQTIPMLSFSYQIMFSQKDLCISKGFTNWISSFHDFLHSLALARQYLVAVFNTIAIAIALVIIVVVTSTPCQRGSQCTSSSTFWRTMAV